MIIISPTLHISYIQHVLFWLVLFPHALCWLPRGWANTHGELPPAILFWKILGSPSIWGKGGGGDLQDLPKLGPELNGGPHSHAFLTTRVLNASLGLSVGYINLIRTRKLHPWDVLTLPLANCHILACQKPTKCKGLVPKIGPKRRIGLWWEPLEMLLMVNNTWNG